MDNKGRATEITSVVKFSDVSSNDVKQNNKDKTPGSCSSYLVNGNTRDCFKIHFCGFVCVAYNFFISKFFRFFFII